jgi:hypothetical protein
MSSVPTGNAGVASAINNAISRVGQPILAALIFVVVSGTFYATLGAIAGLDPNDPTLRQLQPLTTPPPGTPPAVAAAARAASVDAFHVAALVSATLLIGGAATNFFGLRGLRSAAAAVGAHGEAVEPAGGAG